MIPCHDVEYMTSCELVVLKGKQLNCSYLHCKSYKNGRELCSICFKFQRWRSVAADSSSVPFSLAYDGGSYLQIPEQFLPISQESHE